MMNYFKFLFKFSAVPNYAKYQSLSNKIKSSKLIRFQHVSIALAERLKVDTFEIIIYLYFHKRLPIVTYKSHFHHNTS